MVLTEVFRHGAFVFLGLVSYSVASIHGTEVVATGGASSVVVPDATPTRESVVTEVCEARTINYITHALPQSCLTSSWKRSSPTSNTLTATEQMNVKISTASNDDLVSSESVATVSDLNATETVPAEPAVTTFMSFEDWKEMMLRRAGQDPQDLRSRRPSEHLASDRYSTEIGHAGLGEEGEISLNFEHYGDGDEIGISNSKQSTSDSVDQHVAGNALAQEDGKTAAVHLSKDAGKTCKERFSYSSFDAGATILKTSPGAKNAKAILVENKDTYMLLECDVSSKYVIIELSDDISVDTVVLANFEFFSSMIRHFRVSVSDRYPVKLDKWRELGTFEARNSRDIQPFLVENPQIWAKYVRIEFLTHFGNEYYCPISLLRIHGSRMLDSWKDSETNRDDDIVIDKDEIKGSSIAPNASQVSKPASQSDGQYIAEIKNVTVWKCSFERNVSTIFEMTCPALPSANRDFSNKSSSRALINENTSSDPDLHISEVASAGVASTKATPHSGKLTVSDDSTIKVLNTNPGSQDGEVIPSDVISNDTVSSSNSTVANERPHNATATFTKVSTSGGQTMKHRSSGTTGPPAASPTMQEGFFHAITKRLQQVESNLTLSMKYVEDQSKHVQEALQSREQKQQAKIALFLDDLNKTVLSELHSVREQYDQIWQSTVLALESQRDRSERDMMALSTRLNLLADEVVFQKRMAIVQAIILLSCLFLIIFSRGISLPSLGPLIDQSSTTTAYSPSNLPKTSQHLAYQVCKKCELESHRSPMAQALSEDVEPHANADKSSGPSSTQSKNDCLIQNTASSTHSCYHRLSPPLSSSPPDELQTLDDDRSANTYAKSRQLLGISLNNIRKPLPSLPEHPPSPKST